MPIRTRELRAFVALIAFVLLATAGLFLTPKWKPELHRLPFAPKLIVGERHPLCRDWLALARREFLKGRAIPLAPPQYAIPLRATEQPQFIDLDVFGDGKPLHFVLASRIHSWRGEVLVFGAYRDPSRRIQSIDEIWSAPSRDALVEPFDARYVGLPIPRILRFDEAIYFARSEPVDTLYLIGERHPIWRVTELGERENVCELEVTNSRREPAPLPNLAKLSSQMDHVVGTDAVCGSACPQQGIRVTSASVAWRLYRQPWSFPDVGDSVHRDLVLGGNRAIDILNYWSTQGAWAYEVTARIKAILPKAREELIGYYVTEYFMPRQEAATLVDTALFSYLAAHFNLSSEVKGVKTRSLMPAIDELLVREHITDVAHEYDEWRSEHNRKKAVWPYQAALLYGAPAESVVQLPSELRQYLSEPELVLAVRWPHLIRHIVERDGQGVFEEGNSFGKTALMYAAHFHLHDSASVLLALGANPNGRTGKGSLEVPVQIASRTALMYAAENSDRRMIELLLAHGADKTVRDTENRRALDYLKNNSRVSAEEKSAMAGLLE